MLIILNFDWRIDATPHGNIFYRTISPRNFKIQILLRFDRRGQTHDVVTFRAIKLESLRRGALLELQR